MSSEKRILNVGLSCLDIVMVVNSYPKEDSDQRCKICQWKPGGNACNNTIVMTELDVPCEYFGTMGLDYAGKYLREYFEKYGINHGNCVLHDNCESPTSIVLVNSINGSRTIVHSNKNFPELNLKDFRKLDLSKYKWIHFEARQALSEITQMVEHVRNFNKQTSEPITISIEFEKPISSHIEGIGVAVDVVFISKDLAMKCNYNDMKSAVKNLSQKLYPGAILICPWGENGACAISSEESLVESSAFPPSKLVDTLCAGDTFIAATVTSLSKGLSLQESIIYGCRVAGAKCGILGVKGLKEIIQNL